MRVGGSIIFFTIVAVGLWMSAPTLSSRIPMWPFLLAGFHFMPVLADLAWILEFVVSSIRLRTVKGGPR